MDNAMLQNLLLMTGAYPNSDQSVDFNNGIMNSNEEVPCSNEQTLGNLFLCNTNTVRPTDPSSNDNVDLLTQYLQLQRERRNPVVQNQNDIFYNSSFGSLGNLHEPDVTQSTFWNFSETSLQALHPNPINFASSEVAVPASSMMMMTTHKTQNFPPTSDETPLPHVQQNDESWMNKKVIGQNDDLYERNGIVGPWSAFSAQLLGDMALTSESYSSQRKKRKSDTEGKPKRPLSAYNIFFKEERNRILANIPDTDAKETATVSRKRKKRPHGKIGFECLAKVIGQRWQALHNDERDLYKEKAQQDMQRYKAEMESYVSGEVPKQLEIGIENNTSLFEGSL